MGMYVKIKNIISIYCAQYEVMTNSEIIIYV